MSRTKPPVKRKPRLPSKLSDLKAAGYNPRTITDQALIGLSYSLEAFGDLSGIVFNKQTGNLVSGHQRVRALQAKHGELEIFESKIATPEHTYTVRVVDWPLEKEKAANVIANSPTIQGQFTPELFPLLEEIKNLHPESYEHVNLEALFKLPFSAIEGTDPEFEAGSIEEQGKLDEKNKVTCPECGHEFAPEA